MKVAIIDDDIMFSRILYKNINIFMEKLFSKFKIDIINNNFLDVLEDSDYDLLFLDIGLKELSGIDVGKKVLFWENNPIIIFVSSRNELVFSSLSVRPFYFVRKSSFKDDLSTVFILLKKYFKENMIFFTFEFHGRKTDIFLKDIYIIESKGHNIILKTKNGEYTYRSTMGNILEVLGTKTIVQIQKSFAINIGYIKEINKNSIYLKNNEEYNIGRKFKKTVMQKYKETFLI